MGKDAREGDLLSAPAGEVSEPRDFDLLRVSVPCLEACPARTDIPGYLQAIAEGDPERAYRINLRDNVFPGVLGRVCTRPCEPACRHGAEGLGEPVAICPAKRACADVRPGAEPVILGRLFEDTGRRVAVVGAGPAGLTVARELARFGHAVRLFERDDRPGGLMVQGLPVFRLPRDVVEREITQALSVGVALHLGVCPDLDELLRGHEAVVLATGAQRPVLPEVPGLDLPGVEHGLPFLRRVNRGEPVSVGRRVVVIGGGFTAVDCARVARRLGAEAVRVFYRRSEREMYITPGEVDAMREEGIEFTPMVLPLSFVGEGSLRAVRLAKVRLGGPDASGRPTPGPEPGSEFEVEADTVLLGTGQRPDAAGKKGFDGPVFLAGDAATGSTSLIDAIGHARRCARRVDEWLMGARRLGDRLRIGPVVRGTGRTRVMDALPRQPVPAHRYDPERPDREAEAGLPEPAARVEASRCYQCQYLFEIDNRRCIYCDMCLRACPVAGCIVKVNRVLRDGQGRWRGWVKAEGLSDYHLLCIDPSLCIRCGLCVPACPVDCIPARRLDLLRMEAGVAGDYDAAARRAAGEDPHG